MKTRFPEILLILVATAVGYGVCEIAYRAYLYSEYAVDGKFAVATLDAPILGMPHTPRGVLGPYTPDRVVTRNVYDANDRLISQSRHKINNFGWTSGSDYTREKPAGEYRIAVVGDSLTANINSSVPWTDVLQRHLRADRHLISALGVETISVLNLGVGGASMSFMATPLSVIARQFSSDMLVVNFPIEDIARRISRSDELEMTPDNPSETGGEVRGARHLPTVRIGDVEVPMVCEDGDPSLANPKCRILSILFVPQGRDLSAAEVREVKAKLAREVAWQKVVLNLKPLLLYEVLGAPIVARAQAQVAPLTHNSGNPEADMALGLRSFAFIHRLHRNVLVTHNPLQWHLDRSNRPAVLDQFLSRAKDAGYDVVQMEAHMPIHLGAPEWTRWYMMPIDGHWSDYGAEVYGRAMYRVVRSRLLQQKGVSDPDAEGSCGAAFTHFQAGADQRAAELLPPDVLTRVRRAESYQDCGFAGVLFARLTQQKEKEGDAAAAEQWFRRAIEVSENPEAPRSARAARRAASGDRAGAMSDLAVLIAAAPRNSSYRAQRGQLLLSEDPVAASEDLTVALQEAPQPEHLAILFDRAQARMAAGNPAGTVEDATAALRLAPNNGGLLFMRANALLAIGQPERALGDYDAAIEAMPGTAAFIEARESVRAALAEKN